MAENLTLARPYAKAVFEQAKAGSALDEWTRILKTLAFVAQEPQAALLLDNPLVSEKQLRDFFSQIIRKFLNDSPNRLQQELDNFLGILIREKRLMVLPEIYQRYQDLIAAQRGIKTVIVTSAFPLDDARRQSMTESLSRYLKSQLEVQFQEDAGLIGGAVIRSGNWVMDGSIKGKLQKLRDNLQK
jgi:F-type H+-transporting ATPase subunit delta